MTSTKRLTLLALTLALITGFAGQAAHADDMANPNAMKNDSTMSPPPGDGMMKKDGDKMAKPNAMMKKPDTMGKPDAGMKSDSMSKDKMPPDSGMMSK